MKKYLLIWLMVSALFLAACGEVKMTAHTDSIRFDFPEEYKQYLPYGDIPYFELQFPGLTVNTHDSATTSNKKVFGNNDDFAVSEIFSSLFSEYQNRLSIRILEEVSAFETKMNRLAKDKNGEYRQEPVTLSVEDNKFTNEIAFIQLENGLILSVEYRKFTSFYQGETKTFYSWRYQAALNAVLHYPLIVIKTSEGEKELLIIPLPKDVLYTLGVNERLLLSRILNNDRYLDESYRKFLYPGSSDDPKEQEEFDVEASRNLVKEYYRNYSFEETDAGMTFIYLGKQFSLRFLERHFQIDYLKDVS